MLRFTIEIEDIYYNRVGTLTVLEDRWILNGRTLGPETCAALDFLVFHDPHRPALAVTFALADILRSLIGTDHVLLRSSFAVLIEWLRANFDYPVGGKA